MTYISIINACAIRWLPKWKGLASGVVVSGFGLGAVLFAYTQMLFINPKNYIPEENEGYFTHPDVLSRVPSSFLVFGGVHMVMQVVGSLFLTNPPTRGTLPCSQNDSIDPTSSIDSTSQVHPSRSRSFGVKSMEDNTSAHLSISKEYSSSTVGDQATESSGQNMYGVSSWTPNIITSLTPRQMVGTCGFCYLWLLLVFGGIAVSAVVTLYKFFGQVFIKDDYFLATVGSVSAVFNSAGSLSMGVFADKFNYKAALVCLTAVMSSLLLTFYASIVAGRGMYFIWVCALFYCVGGFLTLFPTAIARSFGSKYFATNYGVLFTASSLSAGVSALISSFLLGHISWYGYLFVVSGFCLVAFVIALLYRRKRYLPFLRHPERESS